MFDTVEDCSRIKLGEKEEFLIFSREICLRRTKLERRAGDLGGGMWVGVWKKMTWLRVFTMYKLDINMYKKNFKQKI